MHFTKRESKKNVCKDTGKPFLRPRSWRLKISKSRRDYYKNNPSKLPRGKNNPMFGVVRKGKKNPNFGNKWSEKKKKEFSKKQSQNSPWKGRSHSIKTRLLMSKKAKQITKSEKWKKNMRTSALKRAKLQGRISYNIDACCYFDKLNQEKRWNLQHAKNGGEISCIGYSLDSYDKKRNIVVEYDEAHHFDLRGCLKPKDVTRMNRIIEYLHCRFLRYNEKTRELKEY